MKRTAIFALALILFLPGALPANAESYNNLGNQLIAEGKIDVATAIKFNLAEYMVRTVADVTGIPLSPDDLLEEGAIAVLTSKYPELGNMFLILDLTRSSLEAYSDLAHAAIGLSKAKQAYFNAVMANVEDYIEQTAEAIEAIRARAEQDVRNGTEIDEAHFANLDRLLDGSDLASRIRNDANHIVFFFDPKSRNLMRAAADRVEAMSNGLIQMGSREIYRAARRNVQPTDQQTQAESQPQARSDTELRRTGVVFNTFSSGLILRDRPAKNAKQIGSLFDGYQVTVIGDGPEGGYYKVEYQGKIGWVTADYIRILSEAEETRRTGVVFNTFSSGLILRDRPAKNAKQIGSLFDGYQVTVIGDGPEGGYYKVEYKGKIGWVTADYIRILDNQPMKSAGTSAQLASIRSTAPDKDNTYYYSDLNIFYKAKLSPPHKTSSGQQIKGNCTWYAWGRLYELLGHAPGNTSTHGNIFRGDAYSWWDRNIASGKYSYGSEPRPGAVAVWGKDFISGNLGHVAIVEKVEDGKVYISESGWINLEFRYTTTDKYGTQGFLGYIYVV